MRLATTSSSHFPFQKIVVFVLPASMVEEDVADTGDGVTLVTHLPSDRGHGTTPASDRTTPTCGDGNDKTN